MEVLVLQGPNNSGKTATIRALVQKMLDSGEGQFIKQADRNKHETKVDFSLPFLYRGYLLAITTYGDGVDLIKPFYEQYKDFAAVIVFAAHPIGRTNTFVENLEKQYSVCRVEKSITSSDERNTAECSCVTRMLDTINKLLQE